MAKTINKIIKVLITSDFFLNLGWGLIGPIFAIFILQNIVVENVLDAARVAGFASLCYWAVKSILQIPIGHFLDKNHGEKDDFLFMVVGTFVAGFIPLGYLISSQPWHIYVLQMIYAAGMSMVFPSWLAIFTRHIDKGREGLEWGIESTFLGAGAGIAGGMGGVVASVFGFELVFIAISCLTFFSAFLLLLVRKEISPIDKKAIRIPLSPFVEP